MKDYRKCFRFIYCNYYTKNFNIIYCDNSQSNITISPFASDIMKNPKELYQKLIKKLKLIDNPPISFNYHIYNYLSHIYDIIKIKIKSKNTLAIIYTYITKKYYSSLQ